jgi:CRP-like cAMP-binding protein
MERYSSDPRWHRLLWARTQTWARTLAADDAFTPAGPVIRRLAMPAKTIPDAMLRFLVKIPELDDAERRQLAETLPLREFRKGAILLRQGDVPVSCYFVLKGCIRQFSLTEDGAETSIEFFMEEEAVLIFGSQTAGKPSEYSLACIEASLILVGDLSGLPAMFAKYPKLVAITRTMMERDFAKTQEDFAAFKALSPEARYRSLLEKRPELLARVPQYQLASYIGVTPESLSRIRKRIS